MSFAEPILLAGFILIPLAVLAYGSLQRRRKRESAAWANPALVPNLVAGRPGWRRHIPPLLLLIALAVLVVALARPQRTVTAGCTASTSSRRAATRSSTPASAIGPHINQSSAGGRERR